MGRDRISAMRALLEPESIALVGASPRHNLVPRILATARRFGYEDRITLVHRGEESIDGFPCVASIADLDSPPDFAGMLMGPSSIVPALREVADFGVPAALVFADGFPGEEGAQIRRELRQVARDAEMVVLGPNSEGVFNFAQGVGVHMEEVKRPTPGSVGLISESGSVSDRILYSGRGVQWSHVICTGDETVSDAADFLAYLVDAPECEVICLFLEAVRRPQEFLHQCDRARAAGKPVIVLKVGRSEQTAAAVAAHTGALAQPYRLVDALLRRHRVVPVESIEEMVATVVILQARRRAGGNRIGMVADSGGLIELMLDAARTADIDFPTFSDPTIRELAPMFNVLARLRNPIDIWPPTVDGDTAFRGTYRAVSGDEGIDIVATTELFTPDSETSTHVDYVIEAAKASDKPFVVIDPLSGGPSPKLVRKAREAGVAIISGLDSSMRALEHLVSHSAPDRPPADVGAGAAPEATIVEGLRDRGGGTGLLALDVLRHIGLNVPPTVVASDAGEAMRAATEIGFPVVVKDADPHNAHKTETGGVFLHLRSEQAVDEAAGALFAAGADGVLVQREADIEHELLIGLQTDQELGSFVVVGMGGIWAEILDDVAIRPVGLRSGDARAMLESLRAYPVLRGARGRPPADLDGVIDALERLDAFGWEYGAWFQSVDINPLVCGADGVFAVDALFTKLPAEQDPSKEGTQ